MNLNGRAITEVMLRNVFDINVENQTTEMLSDAKPDGDRFIVREASPEQLEAVRQKAVVLKERLDESGLPQWAQILNIGCALAAAYCLLFGISLLLEGGYVGKAAVMLTVGVLCAAGVAALCIIAKKRRARFAAVLDEAADAFADAVDGQESALGIPKDAVCVDFFYTMYTQKKGNKQPVDVLGGYMNTEQKVWSEDSRLMIGNVARVLAIPQEAIVGIWRLDTRAYFSEWHKTELPNSAQYREYSIIQNSGRYSIKPVYSIEVVGGDEHFQLIVPHYDIKPIERLTDAPMLSLE